MDSVPVLDLLSALPHPVLLIGPSERIEAANPAAILLLGDGTGRHYITALRQPAILDAIETALATGKPQTARYLGAEGRKDTTWQVSVGPLMLDTGRGVLLSFADVTAVEEAGQIRRDFVANVSHELRTPLAALLGFVETLRGPARDDPVARDRFLEIMSREADRMARLIADLLSLSKVEEGERQRPMTPVPLKPLIDGVIAAFGPAAESAGVRLVTDLPEADVVIPAEAEQLRQVLSNLVENALKYGGGGGVVEIALGEPRIEPGLRSTGVVMSVTDHGEGIAGHHIPRLTERFYRIDGHRSREVGGTGLGLAIVKHIVNRHRGRLRIDSKPGQGTRVSVILPAA